MRFPRKRGSTSVMVRVFIPDNTVTTGAGCTGLTSGSTNLAIAYSRELQNGATQITGANLVTITTIGTWASPGTGKLGFKAVDATNLPGLYEIHFPDDAAASGTGDASRHLIINVLELTTTALKIGPNMVMIPLSARDVSEGEANAVAMSGTTLTARDIGASVLLSSGSGTGQLDFTSGVVKANATQVDGAALDTHDAGSFPADVRTWVGAAPNALVSGRVDASAGAVAADAITASAIAADAIGSSELAATAATEIADAILSRNVSNVEATAAEHTLCTAILAMLENSISGTTLTIKRTDGSTTHFTKTLTTDPSAEPITGIT